MLLSDDRLTRRAIGGDQGAFTAIFERYQAPLYRYCLAILGDREDAEDALQSTMVKVLRALPGEKRRIELKPWLYRIAHNESVELIRRRRPSEELDAELLAAGAGLAEEASGRERLRHLLADIGQLPERQRGTLVMRELGGLGFEEIGAALGTSAAVARQTLYEARLGLREMDAGREMGCDEVTRAISDADGRVLRRRDIRAHLRTCEGCRRFREEIGGRERDLAALSPLPAALAAGLLQTVLGGAGAGTGAAGGSGAALGAGAAKTIGAATLFKGAATVAAVAVIGVGAADRSGLIHVGLPGGSSSSTTSKSDQPAVQAAPAGTAASDAGADGPASAQPAAAAALDRASRVPKGGAGTEGDASGGPAATPGDSSVGGSPAADPQLPSASAHGQETAAAHKASGNKAKGNGSAAGKASKPAKPSHPEQQAHPAKPVHPEHPSKKPALSAAPPAASGAGATAKPMPAAPAHEGKP
jgi:RNA polymerase sigma factor (sigma-70 family)